MGTGLVHRDRGLPRAGPPLGPRGPAGRPAWERSAVRPLWQRAGGATALAAAGAVRPLWQRAGGVTGAGGAGRGYALGRAFGGSDLRFGGAPVNTASAASTAGVKRSTPPAPSTARTVQRAARSESTSSRRFLAALHRQAKSAEGEIPAARRRNDRARGVGRRAQVVVDHVLIEQDAFELHGPDAGRRRASSRARRRAAVEGAPRAFPRDRRGSAPSWTRRRTARRRRRGASRGRALRSGSCRRLPCAWPFAGAPSRMSIS